MNTLYRLKPRVKLLKDFFVFDTETGIRLKDNQIQWDLQATPDRLIFGVVYGWNYTKVIYTVDEFIAEFKDPRYKNKKVFAHNAGAYDLLVLFGGTPQGIFLMDPNAIFIGSKFICATNGVCIFADSLNIFQTSLRKLGKMLGKKKGHLPRVTEWPNPKVINYCIRDCEILWEALFMTFEFAGDIKITQASLAMTYFRRSHQEFNIEHNPNTAFFWLSYFGGRTEAFKLGPTHSNVIDCNSMYPAQMKGAVFPNPKFLKVSEYVQIPSFLKNILPNYEGMILATVRHKPTTFGYLPFKNDKGKLLFPIGVFSGAWNFPEIRYAIESGAIEILKIDKCIYGTSMPTPFKGFVDTLYEARFKTDLDFEIYRIKIFMNSLSGKLAQRIQEETIYIADITEQFHVIRDYQTKGLYKRLQMFSVERNDAFLIIKSTKGFRCSFSIPSFPSYITSYARVSLLKKLYELEKNVPVYCDTDSIFYEIDSTEIPNDKYLGGWKREGFKTKWGWMPKIVTQINGLKNYKYLKPLKYLQMTKEIHLIKGVPVKAKQIGPNEWEYSTLTRSKESLRRGEIPGVPVKRSKKISGIYDKRIVLENGETKPFDL